jgi:hypothetical protein
VALNAGRYQKESRGMIELPELSAFRRSSPESVYDVFISYSHAKDRYVAAALQRVIQNLGKPWYKRWSLWVFRDDTSLSAAPGLRAAIERALSKSRFLILLASCEAAASPWVGKEVEYWLEHKSADTLLIALTDNELSWDTEAGDFRWSIATPLPSVLKARMSEEPKWVDLRAFRDKKSLRSQRNRRFTNLAADLAAAVHGMPREDLLTEEIRQKKRGLKLAWSMAALLLVLAATAGWQWKGAVAADRMAVEQRDVAQARLDRGLKILHHLADDGKLTADEAGWVRLTEQGSIKASN